MSDILRDLKIREPLKHTLIHSFFLPSTCTQQHFVSNNHTNVHKSVYFLCSVSLFCSPPKKVVIEYVTAYLIYEAASNTKATSNNPLMNNTITGGLGFLFRYVIYPLVHFFHPSVSGHFPFVPVVSAYGRVDCSCTF